VIQESQRQNRPGSHVACHLFISHVPELLTVLYEAMMYSRRAAAGSELVKVVSSNKYYLSDSNVVACSGPQVKSLAPRRVLRKGRLRSADHVFWKPISKNLWVKCAWIKAILRLVTHRKFSPMCTSEDKVCKKLMLVRVCQE
jgi:hypothetical protein